MLLKVMKGVIFFIQKSDIKEIWKLKQRMENYGNRQTASKCC